MSKETSRGGGRVSESYMRAVKEGDYVSIICGSCGQMFREETATESEYGSGALGEYPHRSCKHDFVKCLPPWHLLHHVSIYQHTFDIRPSYLGPRIRDSPRFNMSMPVTE